MSRSRRRASVALWLAVLSPALLSACSAPPARGFHRPLPVPGIHREAELNARWKGQPYNTLVEVLGHPRLTMDLPYRSEKQVAVYGVVDAESGCIDAYSVERDVVGEPRVLEYFCR